MSRWGRESLPYPYTRQGHGGPEGRSPDGDPAEGREAGGRGPFEEAGARAEPGAARRPLGRSGRGRAARGRGEDEWLGGAGEGEVGQDEGGHGFDHGDEAGADAGVVAAVGGD